MSAVLDDAMQAQAQANAERDDRDAAWRAHVDAKDEVRRAEQAAVLAMVEESRAAADAALNVKLKGEIDRLEEARRVREAADVLSEGERKAEMEAMRRQLEEERKARAALEEERAAMRVELEGRIEAERGEWQTALREQERDRMFALTSVVRDAELLLDLAEEEERLQPEGEGWRTGFQRVGRLWHACLHWT